MRIALALTLLLLAAGCGGGEDRVTIYLPQRLGPEGAHGQIAPVLVPLERERREGMSAAWQAVLELRVGPAPEERARGVLAGVAPGTRLVGLRVAAGTATVDLAGAEPDVRATAAIVYSLTDVPGIDAVRLRLDGRACCAYRHDGSPVVTLTRGLYRGWSGEPCHVRAEIRCRG